MIPKKLALYVDAQNLWHAARNYGHTVGFQNARADYEALLVEVLKFARERLETNEIEISRQVLYSVSRKRALRFSQALGRIGYEVQDHILKSDTDTYDWDTQIALDALRDAPLVDLVIIVSGDGDLAPVLAAVRDQGTDAVGSGFPGSTSSRFEGPHLLTPAVLYKAG